MEELAAYVALVAEAGRLAGLGARARLGLLAGGLAVRAAGVVCLVEQAEGSLRGCGGDCRWGNRSSARLHDEVSHETAQENRC